MTGSSHNRKQFHRRAQGGAQMFPLLQSERRQPFPSPAAAGEGSGEGALIQLRRVGFFERFLGDLGGDAGHGDVVGEDLRR